MPLNNNKSGWPVEGNQMPSEWSDEDYVPNRKMGKSSAEDDSRLGDLLDMLGNR